MATNHDDNTPLPKIDRRVLNLGRGLLVERRQPNTLVTKKVELPTAIKYDEGKANWSLMPFEAIEDINKVLEFGAKKYDGWNYAKGSGMSYSRILNSLLRHIFAYMRGEDLDKESGLSHLAHAGCNIVFLLYYNKYKEQYSNDDRVKR